MPALFKATDEYSKEWQDKFIRCQKIQLTFLVFAAAGGATAFKIFDIGISAFVVIISLVGSIFIRLYMAVNKPERKWYNGRAAAESIKTLTWKLIQGAKPFSRPTADEEAKKTFLAEIHGVLKTVPTLDKPSFKGASQITASMIEVRNGSLASRKQYYIENRIDDQIQWYADKSTLDSRRAKQWSLAVATFEVVGIIMAVIRLKASWDYDVTGILATFAVSGVAWMQTRQYESLSQAYAVTSQELASVKVALEGANTEAQWSEEVATAEEAISREHTLWRASRSRPNQ